MRAIRICVVLLSLVAPPAVVAGLLVAKPPKAEPAWRVGDTYSFDMRWGDLVFTVHGTIDNCDCPDEPPRVAVK